MTEPKPCPMCEEGVELAFLWGEWLHPMSGEVDSACRCGTTVSVFHHEPCTAPPRKPAEVR